MLVCLSVKMLYILVLCPVFLAAAVQTLTIDSQLGTSIEDCFERISIGDQLPPDAIYRNVTELTTIECEQICKQDKQCQSFDYGVGAKGNATCNLSNASEKELNEKNLLLRHLDYDVYVRRFQCEQSPPSPIQPQFDDPSDTPSKRPVHRPVYRPVDEKQPFTDDYLISSDLASYGVDRPVYKPQYDERPDDYTNPNPDYDSGPSYGAHKPQDLPYKPEKPIKNPSHSVRPDPYDVLQLQDPYRPNDKPGYPVNDYDKPHKRPYEPEKPEYHYITRPKPKPQGDTGYGFNTRPSYGDPSYTLSPGKPYPSKDPYRPRPTTQGQYASGYGQNVPYDNNYIHVEIRDPIRPYDRPRPSDQGIYGYGSYSSQNSYSQSQTSQYYGFGDNQYYYKPVKPNRPTYGSYLDADYTPKPGYGSEKPGYGNQDSFGSNQGGYGSNQNYGSSSQKPNNDYNEPSFSDYDKPSQGTYGGSQSSYGSNQSSYGSNQGSSHGGSRPVSNYRPSYGNDQPAYGSNKPSYGDDQPSYGADKPSYDRPAYGNKPKPSYDNAEPSYGSNKPAYGNDQPTYGNNKPAYDIDRPDYESHKPSYGEDQPAYGGNKPAYGNDQPAYGGNKPALGGDQPSYVSNKPAYGSDQPSYGSNKPAYGNDQPAYGGNKPAYGSDQPSYGSNKPAYGTDQPAYGGNKPAYGDQPGYGGNKPAYGNDQPEYGSNKPAYGSDQPAYGGNKPAYGNDPPSYGGNKPSYGSDQPAYGGNKPAYGSDQPTYGGNKPAYGNDRPSYGNHKPSYGNDQPLYGSGSYGGSHGTHEGSQYYGSNQASYGSHHEYGVSQDSHSHIGYGSHGSNQGGYGQNAYDRPSYFVNRPTLQEPGYGKPQKPKPIYGANDESNQGYGSSSTHPSFDENRPDYINHDDPGDTETGYDKPNKPLVKPVYEDELDKPNNAPSYIARPGGEVVTSRPMAIGAFDMYGRNPGKPVTYEACFRRVLAGKRALRSHVRKVGPCERLEDCRRECATEKRFPCESFNYRLDRTFRGKGLCELMTKPIEAFDLQRDFVEDKDFDFYELDRNSLEPNCPDTLRGPGMLHSGYLSSSKPNRIPERESGWRDRDDGRHRDRFTGERRGSNGGRPGDKFYIPYQINQGLARSDDDENWGQYGGGYGGTDRYYKDRNDYHKSIDHWRIASDIDRPSYGVQPHANTKFDYNSLGKNGGEGSWRYGHGSWKRGRWNSSGNTNGLEYGESNFYKPKSHFHGVNEHGHEPIERSDDGPPIKDCSSRRRPGMSLRSGAIRRSLMSNNVVECEAACFSEREFKCVSYSFRYSSSHGTDNCFLSERPYRGLELSADSSSDVYAMPQDQGCVTINYKPWVESECFWHVRSGAAVSDTAARAALTVAGLGACEAECIRAHAFFCRGFSFRYDSPTIGDDIENCILTSSPPTSLENGRGLRSNSGHELYSRGNYGRGCEPALYDDAHHRDEECYLQYDKAAKLTGSAIRGQARVKDEQSCGVACNEAPFTCLSFSFNNNAPPKTDNCLLSEIRLFDLQRGVDYVHSADDWLFAFDLFNGQCWRKVHSQHFDDSSPEIPRPLSAPPVEDPYSLTGPSGPPGLTGPSGPSGPDYPPDHHDPPYIPSGPPGHPGYKPDAPRYPPASGPGFSDTSAPGYKPHYPPGPSHKPGYSAPSGPDFKPGYPGPSFKPVYPEPSGPDFKPGYPGSSFKPGYSEPSGPDFKPGYPGPSFKPGYSEPSGSDYPGSGFKPAYSEPPGPDYKPGYPGPSSNFKPGYPGPIGPSFKPGYSDDTLNFKPGYPGIDSDFKPGYPPPIKPGYPAGPLNPSYKPGYLPDPDLKPAFRPPRPQRPAYRPTEQDYIPGKPGYLPDKPGYIPDRRPGYPAPNRPFSDVPKPARPGGRPGYPDREIGEPITASFRHYTVSGFPCRAGTTCAQNQVAGHWACEPEGGEIGSWDYCCAPSHRCGYSEGFHKPWCYVGPSEDQWRPCSEKYYPYHQHKVPHPSQGHQQSPGHNREPDRTPQRPWSRPPVQPAGPPAFNDRPQGPPRQPGFEPGPQGPYLSQADRRYWDDLYKNGPQAYYDKFGNPLPGYTRVPTAERPQIKYSHNYPRPGGGQWQQVPQDPRDGPPPALGVPRYWPVAYLHKGPPPNTTYFRYNEMEPQESTTATTTTDRYTTTPREQQSTTTSQPNNVEKHRDEKQRNISDFEDTTPEVTTLKQSTTTQLPEIEEEVKENKTEVETVKPVSVQIKDDVIKGIDDKLDDFSSSIEVLNLDDVKGDKLSELKTLEAEERQIEEIGRILASRRGGKLVLDKRSQKDLETKSIAVDKDSVDFNFGNRFNIERRGVIQKVSKDEIERERAADKSLEVSETSFVRPPRVLSTTENIRKAIVNGKVFYDATIREQRDAFLANSTRKSKSLRNADESKISNLTTAANFGKKIIKTRNANPVRRVRRVYRKRYNPDEVRRRLLEREKNKQESTTNSSRKV